MAKHAYLIKAHNNYYLLEKLVRLLDDERNDIYLLIDQKAKDFDPNRYLSACQYSEVFILPKVKMYWGDYSQVEGTLQLLEQSTDHGYQYYHYLSGVDLPIKTQDFIHEFCEQHDGKEFIEFSKSLDEEWVGKIHLFNKLLKTRHAIIRNAAKWIDSRFIKLQRKLGYDRTRAFALEIKKGGAWFSISHNFARYLIDNRKTLKRLFKFSYIPAEFFAQTLIWNSNFRENIYFKDDLLSSRTRLVDFKRGTPYIFRTIDFEELIASDKLFARKFDEKTDQEIIDKIFDYVQKEQKRSN